MLHRIQLLFIKAIVILIMLKRSSSETENNKLSLKRCCPKNHLVLGNYECVPHHARDLSVRVKLPGEKKFRRMPVRGNETWDYKCSGDHEIRRTTLNTQAYVTLINGSTLFLYVSPGGVEWLVDDFCVGMSREVEDQVLKLPSVVVDFCHDFASVQWKDEKIACANNTCIRKCCPSGMLFNQSCQPEPSHIKWFPEFYSRNEPELRVSAPEDLVTVYGFPLCGVNVMYEKFRLLDSGLVDTLGDFLPTIPPDQYCTDHHVDQAGEIHGVVYACYVESDYYCRARHIIVDLIFMVVSCVCLCASWLIFFFRRPVVSKNYDRCVMSLLVALFLASLSILINRQHEAVLGFFCSFIGTMNHLGILATYFWLTLICFHIWISARFSKMRDGNMVFVAYTISGWGVPLLVALVGAYLPPDDPYQLNRPRADFLPADCWFKDTALRWGYQYGFLLFLFILDIIFHITSFFLVKRKQDAGANMKLQTRGIHLNSRFIVILGGIWMMELVPWLLEANACDIWVSIIDGVAALVGVYIFVAVACYYGDLKVFNRCKEDAYQLDDNATHQATELVENASRDAPNN